MTRAALLFLVAVPVASLAGCARSEAVVRDEVVWSESALREHLRQLAEPIAAADSAQAARRVLYAARRMRAAGLMPARDPSFLMGMGLFGPSAAPASGVEPTRGHVLGYVAGRHPSHDDELVMVAADLDSPGAAVVLEAARALAEAARDTQVPERTVLFALWAPPRTGAVGLRDYLANPTWALDNVVRVLLVATDTSGTSESRRLLEERGIAAEVVTVNDQSTAGQEAIPEVEQARPLVRTVLLTELVYARLRSAALYAPAE